MNEYTSDEAMKTLIPSSRSVCVAAIIDDGGRVYGTPPPPPHTHTHLLAQL